MAKSYANFILMENLLYNVPRGVLSIATLADTLINPKVKIVEESCKSSLGTKFDTVFLNSAQIADLNGQVMTPYMFTLKNIGTDAESTVPPFFTTEELSQAIADGERYQRAYHPFSCTSKGGICRVCAYASYAFSTAKVIDTASSTIYQYFDTPAPFSLVAPQVGESWIVRASYGQIKGFLSPSQKALFSWLADTYSGSLLGIKNFSRFPIPINQSLYEAIVNKNLLARALSDLSKMAGVPKDTITYIEGIDNMLEKALMIVVTYTIYGPRYTAPISTAPDITI